jgi:hypothetical protein
MAEPMGMWRQASLRASKRVCQAPEGPMAEEPQGPSVWAIAVGLSNLTLWGRASKVSAAS